MDEKASPRFYHLLVAVVIVVIIYFGSQLLSGLALFAIPLLLGWSPQQSDAWIAHSTWAQFLFVVMAEALTIGLLYYFMKKRHIRLPDIGMSRLRIRYILQAFGGFILYFVLYIIGLIIAMRLFPGLNLEQKQELGFDSTTRGNDLWLIFISLVVLPPIVEEIVMRGFLFTNLRTKLPLWRSALIVSLLFAVAHLGEGGGDGLLWVAAIDTFILSLVLCYLREKTRSLWPSVGVHMIKNGLAFVVLFNLVHITK